jgi:3-oxoacyl-[acyl-carrier-protein] synthase II
MPERRVVITGLGITSALGTGKEEYYQSLREGRIGIDRIQAFDPSGFPSQIAGESPRFNMGKMVPKSFRKATKLMSRDIELAVIAADRAIRDANLKTKGTCEEGEQPETDPTRCGVNIGAGLICCVLVELGSAVEYAMEDGKFSLNKWGQHGMEALTPLWLLKYLPNMLGCHVSIIHDLQGPSNTVTCAEASGQLAVGEAVRTIQRGKADVMIAGGAENKVNPMALLRQCLLQRTSTKYNDRPKEASRPYDRDADGIVIGEGAGIVVLEEWEHAKRRNAKIYAEVTGFAGSSFHSGNFVDPESDGKGMALALQKALGQSNLKPEQIGFLIPHGLAVPNCDLAESKAIHTAFGTHAAQIPVFLTKSRMGNCGAGAGAIDLVTAILLMSENTIPANLNCPNPPAAYNLHIPQQEVTDASLDHAMTCCYTFGGQSAALVFSKLTAN